MKICLGDDYADNIRPIVTWVRANIPSDKYRLTRQGFLIDEYYLEFLEDQYYTLYLLGCPNAIGN